MRNAISVWLVTCRYGGRHSFFPVSSVSVTPWKNCSKQRQSVPPAQKGQKSKRFWENRCLTRKARTLGSLLRHLCSVIFISVVCFIVNMITSVFISSLPNLNVPMLFSFSIGSSGDPMGSKPVLCAQSDGCTSKLSSPLSVRTLLFFDLLCTHGDFLAFSNSF